MGRRNWLQIEGSAIFANNSVWDERVRADGPRSDTAVLYLSKTSILRRDAHSPETRVISRASDKIGQTSEFRKDRQDINGTYHYQY